MLLAESFDAKQAPKPREGMRPQQHIPRAGRDAKAPGAWRRSREVLLRQRHPLRSSWTLLSKGTCSAGQESSIGLVFFGVESISLVHRIIKALLQGEILPPQTRQSRALSPAVTSSPFSAACHAVSHLPFCTSCSIDHQQHARPPPVLQPQTGNNCARTSCHGLKVWASQT